MYCVYLGETDFHSDADATEAAPNISVQVKNNYL